jgi:hypothetical protein
MCGTLSYERMGLSSGPRQRNHSWVRVPWESRPYFSVSDSILLQPGGPGPHIFIPLEMGGSVISPGSGTLFVAYYDSQGYGEGVRKRLHVGSQYKSGLCYDRLSVGQPVLVSSKDLRPKTKFLTLSGSCWFVDVERSDGKTSLSFTNAAGPRQRSHTYCL